MTKTIFICLIIFSKVLSHKRKEAKVNNRADIVIQNQLKQRESWKDAIVDAVVATLCYREKRVAADVSVLDDYEWLVTKRVKGAEKGQLQAHHGGFLKVTDVDIWDGACREVLEETGYQLDPSELVYLTSVGPAIYRSEMYLDGNSLDLVINSVEAEPNVGFSLPLFVADVTGFPVSSTTDGEVTGHSWMTAREIVQAYGLRSGVNLYSKFNYFQMFLPALMYLRGHWSPGRRAISLPGNYSYKF